MAQRRRSQRQRRQPEAAPTKGLADSLRRRRRPPSGPRKITWKHLVPFAVLAILIAVGVIVNYAVSVKGPNDAGILQVNNRVFKWHEYVSLLKSQKLGAEAFGGSFNAGVAPYQLMQTLAENELIRQAAAREGLHATDDEIRAEVMDRLLPDGPTEGASARQIEQELDVEISRYLAVTQLSRSVYEEIVEIDLLRNQLRDKLGADLSLVQPHAFANVIRSTDQQRVQDIQSRLELGESFSRVARQLSEDEETRLEGGALGWTPRLVMSGLDELLFGLDIGQVSDPIFTDDGVYVIRILSRVADEAHLQAVVFDGGAEAREAIRSLDVGQRFESLGGGLVIDRLVKVGEFDGVFDIQIAGLPVGEVSDPISEVNGTLFLMISERTTAREIDESHIDALKTRQLETWLRREWDANHINYCPGGEDDCFSNLKVDKAIGQAGNVSRTKFEQAATATAKARQNPQSPLPLAASLQST